MNLKIKNTCAVFAALLPLAVLFQTRYTLAGLLVWLGCIFGLILIMSISTKKEDCSILQQSGWILIFVFLAYSGICFSPMIDIKEFSFDHIYHNYDDMNFWYSIIIAFVAILIGRGRKHLLLSRIWEYIAVVMVSYAALVYVGSYTGIPVIPLGVTTAFFFTDYIDNSSRDSYIPGTAVGTSYHMYLAIGFNVAYAFALAFLGKYSVNTVLSFKSIPNLTLICSVVGTVLMLFISAVFREKSTLRNGESSFYLSITAFILILLITKEKIVYSFILMAAYAFITSQFVIYNAKGKVVNAIMGKTQISAIGQNLIVMVLCAVIALGFYKELYLTACVMVGYVLIILLVSALYAKNRQRVYAFGLSIGIYLTCICILWEINQITEYHIFIAGGCLFMHILLLVPVCMQEKILLQLRLTTWEKAVPAVIRNLRRRKEVSIWIYYGVLWLIDIVVCSKIIYW